MNEISSGGEISSGDGQPVTDVEPIYDIAIIGGGINGCGIARDAAGRGYSVLVAEMGDLASGTSSWSTKLIHGGLRYLEHYEFRLVREALMEREVLWAMAPHIIRPLRFVLPHHDGLRPAWLLRLGLFLYDHIGGRRALAATRTLDMRSDPAGKPLKSLYRRAFEYSDCRVDDARLVVLNARDAVSRGAAIMTRTEVIEARREGGIWLVVMRDTVTGATRQHSARLLVNAAGPWVDEVLSRVAANANGGKRRHNVRLVQGSHIVVPRLFDHDRAYMFQNRDDRIIFAIPYEGDFTLIGTTDRDFDGDPASVAITADEIDYLCAAASEYFSSQVTREQIVWSYSGVRPLFDDGAGKAQEATRDYVLTEDNGASSNSRKAEGATLINVFGGKITTYRRLAEEVLERIEGALGAKGRNWTRLTRLPGGDFDPKAFNALVERLMREFGFVERSHAVRLLHAYGTVAWEILAGCETTADLGRHFGADLYQCEVMHLVANEWAMSAQDILWRRSKLGLRMGEDEVRALDAWLSQAAATRAAS